MRRALLCGIVIGAALAALQAWQNGPATRTAASHTALPFGSHLSGWIDGGVPIAAVVELEGRQFLILAGEEEDQSWSVAVDPGETPEAKSPPAAVALGPIGSRPRD